MLKIHISTTRRRSIEVWYCHSVIQILWHKAFGLTRVCFVFLVFKSYKIYTSFLCSAVLLSLSPVTSLFTSNIMLVSEIKDKLRALGAKTTGTKAELLERYV